MSGETAERESGWTVDTLNALVERLLAERDERYDVRFDASTTDRDHLHTEIKDLQRIIETRLDAMDKANQLLYENVNRVPTEVDKQVGHLKELHDEKFRGLETQVAQRFADNQKAVDAAFAAQKEAVAEQNKSSALSISKSEISTTKEIDALKVLIGTTNAGLEDKIGDLRASRDVGKGRSGGVGDAVQVIYAVVGLLLIIGAAILGHIIH